ncbi:MEDS domain-containing protein [Micromonospora sp. WMMD558]|uniref:MEDS domain-containing protein n=1 Tax=unclassified Micromonospora TaxID=2617518 RepID=UPI0012B46D30|nr:MEDS domain-containing protein [Micromonospora sp. WMMC415]QGN45669.1 STAS domain-containing protein [Micromonospora sp. WMMC415]
MPPHGHLCWSYDDQEVFADEAERHVAAGLAGGERVWFVTPTPTGPVAERLAGLPGFAEAVDRGAAAVVPLGETYTSGAVVDPPTQVAAYAAATEAALAAGFTGLRVVAEATDMVRTAKQLDAFTRYEHQIDRWMRTGPFAAMCAYDRSALGDATVAALACMHPESNQTDPLFHLFATAPADGHAALTGELDPSNHELFRDALEWADLRPTDGRLVLQATGLRFLDHRTLIALQAYARRRDATVVLRTSRPTPARLADLLGLTGIHVEMVR